MLRRPNQIRRGFVLLLGRGGGRTSGSRPIKCRANDKGTFSKFKSWFGLMYRDQLHAGLESQLYHLYVIGNAYTHPYMQGFYPAQLTAYVRALKSESCKPMVNNNQPLKPARKSILHKSQTVEDILHALNGNNAKC